MPIIERFNALLSQPGGPQELNSVTIEAQLVGRHYNAQRRGTETLQQEQETPHPALEETSLVIIEKPLFPILRAEKVSVNTHASKSAVSCPVLKSSRTRLS